MNDHAPCLILHAPHRPFTAWNEDGRLTAWSWSFGELDAKMRAYGYDPVPANSRLGRTIQDKIQNPLRHL